MTMWWEDYVNDGIPVPIDADRARIEAAAHGRVPDAYWSLVTRHGGRTLESEEGETMMYGVLLLAVAPDEAGGHASYCVEHCLRIARLHWPDGLLPFGDDTGGNYWAFDFRHDASAPAIVFVDHEVGGNEGVTRVAPDFATFVDGWPK